MQELLRSLGIGEDAVELKNIVINQKTNTVSLDAEVKELVRLSALLRLKELIATKLRMNVLMNIHFLCYDELTGQEQNGFVRDFISTLFPYLAEVKIKLNLGKYEITLPFEMYQGFVEKACDRQILDRFREYFSAEFPICFQCGEKPAGEAPAEPSGTGGWGRRKKTEDGFIHGSPNKAKLISIEGLEIDRPAHVIGRVFGEVNAIDLKNKGVLYKFSIQDLEHACLCTMFGPEGNAEAMVKKLEGQWVEIFGRYERDRYSGDANIRVNGIAPCDPLPDREDNCPLGRRVELHLHTQMSAMDSVLPVKDAIKLAHRWGHPAIAITDHGVVQSFPEAHDTAAKLGMKVIYGCEGYLFEDNVQYIYNLEGSQRTIDDPIVVFDLETTGFYPGQDKIIEIGAVRIEGGKVSKTFQTFVNPKRLIPAEITRLTSITNEMVQHAPEIEEALNKFYAFAGDATLAAHNAKFDTGFLYYFDEQKRFNAPVIDTLPMARRLLPKLTNHKLDTLVKHYGVVLDKHHRADQDAKATGEILLQMLQEYQKLGKRTLQEIQSWSASGTVVSKDRPFHVIMLAKNKTGLHNLYEIVSESHLNYFYKKPRIPKSLLSAKREGMLIGSACEQGELFQAILRNQPQEKIEAIASFYDFLEIQPRGNNMFLLRSGRLKSEEDLLNINRRIYELGKKLGKPVVATSDAHFLHPRDQVFRKILQAGQGYMDSEEDTPLYLRSTGEMLEEFAYLGEQAAREVVIDNTNAIAEMCDVEKPFPDEKTYTPSLEGAEEEIEKLTYTRAHAIYGQTLPEAVEARIKKELNSICGYGYAVLYLIAQKLVKKSMDDGYLVGSRGSVGSSFVAFLSGITEVNPLQPHYICKNCSRVDFGVDIEKYPCGKDLPDKVCEHCGQAMTKDGYDIPFEVFLGFKGDKVPDIDLNFSGEYQPTAHKYIEELFGEGHVYRAGTVSTLQSKTAYGFVKKYAEEYLPMADNAEINRLVFGCAGVKRTTGQHPGGIVIIPKEFDVYDFTPIQYPANDPNAGTITTHFDFNSMHDTLVKVDALGHDDPTMLRTLQDTTGIDPVGIPLDDAETMSIFSSTQALGVSEEDIGCKVGTFGIPEFGTTFVRQMLVETLPKTMAELVRISGLSHGTDVWVDNAQTLIKEGKVTLSEAICTRDDIMNYLIHIGMEPKTAFDIMEMVRKGKGKAGKIPEEYYEAMKQAKTPKWFIESCNKIGYMFPKAHAAAYVMMAFRIAWYKVHRPLEYYAAYFSRGVDDFDAETMGSGLSNVEYNLAEMKNKSEQSVKDKNAITLLEVALEMYKRGLEFLPVDIYHSDAAKFLPEDGKIRLPLQSIPGLGGSVASAIVEQRKGEEFLSIDDLKSRTKINKTTVEIMKKLGYLSGLPDSNQLSLF